MSSTSMSAVGGFHVPTCGPYQEETPVSPLVKLGHYAVNDVCLWGEDVYGVHVSLRGSPFLEPLNVCGWSTVRS